MEKNVEDLIRERAYFMWLDSDKRLDSTVFWLAAEREVLAEVERKAATASRDAEANPETAEHRMARRVNALVLLESGPGGEEADIGVAAE